MDRHVHLETVLNVRVEAATVTPAETVDRMEQLVSIPINLKKPPDHICTIIRIYPLITEKQTNTLDSRESADGRTDG